MLRGRLHAPGIGGQLSVCLVQAASWMKPGCSCCKRSLELGPTAQCRDLNLWSPAGWRALSQMTRGEQQPFSLGPPCQRCSHNQVQSHLVQVLVPSEVAGSALWLLHVSS